MIVGLPYQDGRIVQEELDALLELEPDLCQFLIYGPTPGTPFFEKVKEEGTLREDLLADPELYYKTCDGFSAMVEHPLFRLEGDDVLLNLPVSFSEAALGASAEVPTLL